MKSPLTSLLFALSTTFALPALAGGVSDGGGGTTNPNPANPEWIVNAAAQYSGKVLLVWLNAEEANFNRTSEADRAKSPFRKLFQGEQTIFDILPKASIELRMSAACLDKNGVEWDGSVYASKPGAIC